MSSTNKTANLGLNQWVLTDPLLMEDMNADNQKIDAAVAANPYVKLMDITTSADAQQVNLNVSGIDLRKYAMLQIFTNATVNPFATASWIYARINNEGAYYDESMYNYQNTYQSYVAVFSAPKQSFSAIRMEISGFLPSSSDASGPLLIRSIGACSAISYYMNAGYAYKPLSKISDFASINFLTDNSGVKIAAGSRFVIYGVKL